MKRILWCVLCCLMIGPAVYGVNDFLVMPSGSADSAASTTFAGAPAAASANEAPPALPPTPAPAEVATATALPPVPQPPVPGLGLPGSSMPGQGMMGPMNQSGFPGAQGMMSPLNQGGYPGTQGVPFLGGDQASGSGMMMDPQMYPGPSILDANGMVSGMDSTPMAVGMANASAPPMIDPASFPIYMYGPMGAYGMPYVDESCWGPCKQSMYDQAQASGAASLSAALTPPSASLTAAVASPAPAHPPAPPEASRITTPTLMALMKANVGLVVLDARSGAFDDGQRLPGARGVGEHPSVEEVSTLVPAKNTLIIVYAGNALSNTAKKLAAHLSGLGYENIMEYEEGLQGWLSAGQTVGQEAPHP